MSHLLGEKAIDCLIFISLNDHARQVDVEGRLSDDGGFYRFGDWQERYAALCGKWSEKAVLRKLDELCDRGYIDCGVSARMGWLTEKGIDAMRAYANAA